MTSKYLDTHGKLPFYFSIDLEDFYHDENRRLGNPYPSFKLAAVKKSYEIINRYSDQFFVGRRMTFFVTAIFWLRQNQWSNLGNKTVETKIEQICKIFEHQGPMREHLVE